MLAISLVHIHILCSHTNGKISESCVSHRFACKNAQIGMCESVVLIYPFNDVSSCAISRRLWIGMYLL